MSSSKTILYSASDPGGANAILPVVRMLADHGASVQGIATGPALDAFQKAGLPVADGARLSANDLSSAFARVAPALFLAGSSIGESIDKKIFRMLGTVPSVYVIDFWSHYGHRFVEAHSDLSHVPSRICAIDERMRAELMEEGFPSSVVVITGNPHFDHFTEGITRTAEDRTRVLFVSQPVREDIQNAGAEDNGYDEYTVLEEVIRVLPPALHLSIRLHPRDDAHKYDSYLGERISIATEDTLQEALSRAGIVVGMVSPVLMQAAFAGKPAVSFQPHLTGEDALPTNAAGITISVRDASSLQRVLADFAAGQEMPHHPDRTLFAADATERVVAVVEALLE